jgi:uncharacterized protein
LIQGCFKHLPGIGPRTASALAVIGISSWDDCLARENEIPFRGRRRSEFMENVRQSIRARDERDLHYFTESFPTSEHWRILADYFPSATYIDVETTGLSWHYSHVSVIAAYHRGELHSFVYGKNLDDFLDLADEADFLVTFNGKCFDIPFLEKTFNIPSIGCPHVDLRWIAWHEGYRGGLKSIERQMGIRRPSSVEGIDGFEAVELFYRWQRGDDSALYRLVDYCRADVLATCMVAGRLLNRRGCDIRPAGPEELFALLGETRALSRCS